MKARDLETRLRPLSGLPAGTLLVHEIYPSIQGESTHVGEPCTFVRTTACNLRCRWCDTTHAFFEGRPLTVAEVLAEVERLGLQLVELTGGEPLLQPAALELMTALCDRRHRVLLETSGSLDVRPVDPRVAKIVDLKAPASGEEPSNRYDNVEALLPHDELKLVLADRGDYEWAREKVRELDLARRCAVLFGPAFGRLEPRDLAAWIIADRLPVRMQVQLHKYVWNPQARGV
jgi:7-carboxy-7-deazaguanine synthase